MKRLLLFTFSCALSFSASALELILPAYRSASLDQEVLFRWTEQLRASGIESSYQRLIPLADLRDFVAGADLGPAVIELPPQHYRGAIDAGWAPVTRLKVTGVMSLFALPETGVIESVGSPPKSTVAYFVAAKLTDLPITAFESHVACLRGMASAVVDACVTAQSFAALYSDQFQLQLEQRGDGFPVPPSVMMASPAVSGELLERLRGVEIAFPEFSATYIRFSAERDVPLLQVLDEFSP